MRELIKHGKKLWPNRYMRHQWIRKTLWLRAEGKHILQTGKFKEAS